MKKDIHPDVRRDPGHLHLRQHVHHPQHRDAAASSTPTCARNCHPFYTGKQKILDTGGRVARFEARYAKKADAKPSSCSASAGPLASCGGRRRRLCVSAVVRARRGGGAMFEAVEGLRRRARRARAAAGRARTSTPTTRLAKRLNQRYAALTAVVARLPRVAAARRRHRGRPRAGRRGRRRSPTRPSALDAQPRRAPRSGCGGCWCRATRPTTRTRSSRSRRARAARSRRCSPATCCGCTPATPSAAAGRPRCSTPPSPTSAAYKSRHGRGQGQGHAGARRGAVRAAEVRGRRAPRPAGAGHRVAGPRSTPRAAGVLVMPEAEQVDVDDRRERPAHRRLPLVGPGRPERQHDRLGGPDHPPADRHRGLAARTRRASCRTASRRCAILRARLLAAGAGGGRRRGRRRAPLARCAPSTAPSGSAPTTSRRTGSPTTASATRPTTSTRCSTATSQPVDRRLRRGRPGRPARGRSSSDRVTPPASLLADGRRAAAPTAGVASPEHDAAELLAHVLGTTRGRARRWSTTSPTADRGRVRRPGRPPGRREPLQHLTGRRPSATSSSRSGPACSCRGPRPRCWPAGRSSRRPPLDGAGRGRPVHRLRRDRAGGRRRGARRARARRRARRRGARAGPRATWPAPGVDLRHGDIADALRRPRRHGRRGGLQPAVHPARGLGVGRAEARDHDPAPRAVVRRRRPRRDPGASQRAAARLLAAGGVVGVEHADVQGESAPARVRRRPGAGPRSATTATWPGAPRFVDARGWHDDRP